MKVAIPRMKTPILLLIFKRPKTTRRVMAAISHARPSRLYVAADGPRAGRADEKLCEEARQIATSHGWPCTVRTLFRDRNLGCRVAVSTALDWFFEQEEQGIILEDDCVPSPTFFPFCNELLDRFRDDERIMCISGDNFQKGRFVTPHSYYFSRYMHCWGWATWRRAWSLYDREMSLWPEFRRSGGLEAWSDGQTSFEKYWEKIFDTAAAGKVDSWAYRFLFSCWVQGGLTCLPEKNLVANIGFGEDSTNTTCSDHWFAGLPAEDLQFPLRHPKIVVRDVQADRYSDRNVFLIAFEPSARDKAKAMLALIKKISFAERQPRDVRLGLPGTSKLAAMGRMLKRAVQRTLSSVRVELRRR